MKSSSLWYLASLIFYKKWSECKPLIFFIVYLSWGKLSGSRWKLRFITTSWAKRRLNRSLADSMTSSRFKVLGGLAAGAKIWNNEGQKILIKKISYWNRNDRETNHKHRDVDSKSAASEHTHRRACSACWSSRSWSFRGNSPGRWLTSCCRSAPTTTPHRCLGPHHWMWRWVAHRLEASWVTAAHEKL